MNDSFTCFTFSRNHSHKWTWGKKHPWYYRTAPCRISQSFVKYLNGGLKDWAQVQLSTFIWCRDIQGNWEQGARTLINQGGLQKKPSEPRLFLSAERHTNSDRAKSDFLLVNTELKQSSWLDWDLSQNAWVRVGRMPGMDRIAVLQKIWTQNMLGISEALIRINHRLLHCGR